VSAHVTYRDYLIKEFRNARRLASFGTIHKGRFARGESASYYSLPEILPGRDSAPHYRIWPKQAGYLRVKVFALL
jgi:hypothetical protein